LFSRQLLLDLGGYQTHSVGEDMELVVRANRLLRQRGQPYRMWFSAHALCLTEAPHVLGELGRQRTRWHQGLLSTLRLHKSMFGRPAFGSVGMVAFPFFVAELFYPFFEVVGWLVLPVFVALGWMPFTDALEVVLAFVLFSSIVSFVAIGIDAAFFSFFSKTQDRITLMAASVVEQCGYHQCTIFFRLRAFLRYYRSLQLRTAWQPPTRAAAKTTAPTDRPG
jgi:cellulose synthase/poly-beta-1,6-N-acetylglucosamine synthase-like glycosyltransferase